VPSARNISLPYGSGKVGASVPQNWRLEELTAPKKKPLRDVTALLEKILDNPVGSRPFNAIFKDRKRVAIVVPDKTRRCGVDILLPTVLERLEKIGIADITIIFATGIHPGQSEEEKRAIVGEEIYSKYRCVDHDARGELADVGAFLGKPLMLNRDVAEADGKIIIGGVKLHYLAGFGGGRKAIMPGVASHENCIDFHRLSLNAEGSGRHPRIGAGILEGNPMHIAATEAAKMAGVDFVINTVLDEEGIIVFINGGTLEDSFAEAVKEAESLSVVPIKGKGDVVIASCGGYPADINFIQSQKSLDFAYRGVKPGGVLVLLAECRDGIGNADFLKWFDHRSVGEMDMALRKNFVINGQTAMATREKTEAVKVFLLSSLPDEAVIRMGMTPVRTLDDALKEAQKIVGDNELDAFLIKHASSFMPIAK